MAAEEKGQKVRKGQTFLDHTYSKDSSRRRGKCVQRLFKIGYEM
jgi:hypothetical protein